MRDASFLKQLAHSLEFSKVHYQDQDSFDKFEEQIEHYLHCAGISEDNRRRLFDDESASLSKAIDGQIELIIARSVDPVVLDRLGKMLPSDEPAISVGDLRNLRRLFS